MGRMLSKIRIGMMILCMLVMIAPGITAEQLEAADAGSRSEQSAGDAALATALIEGVQPEEAATVDEKELEEKIPLAGGAEPTVAIRANHDTLRIGDELVLTAELSGFDGLDCRLRWQARISGQWTDLAGKDSSELRIVITKENSDWVYRAVVDAQPVKN